MALLFVALTATAVVAPLWFLGTPSGHDIQFHLSSWIEVARQWRQGILFPRWAEWANWGFGEPRFLFYPPVSWTLGGALGSLLPWKMVPGAMIWISLAAAGISMWTLAKEWLPGREAIAAAVFFAAGPYNQVMLYYRSDFAELLGAALFPLVFRGALRVLRGQRGAVPALAAAFAAVWLCNAPAGVMVTYSLVLALAAGCAVQRSLRPLFPGALATVAGFGLAAFYILPAAYEQRWVQIASAIGDSLRPDRNFLFARQNELGFLQFNARVSYVAAGMMAATLVAGAASLRQRRKLRELWWIMAAVALFAIFLMFPASLVLWHALPKLWYMQFPWRWLDALAVPLALFAAAAAGSFRPRWAFWAVALLVIAGLTVSATRIVQDTWWDDKDASYIQRGIQAGHGYDGTDEYAPLGVSHWDLPGEPPNPDDKEAPPPAETPRIEQVSVVSGDLVPVEDVSVRYETWTADTRVLSVTLPEPRQLALRLVNYPAWQVRVDGILIHPGYQPVTGQMVLPVAAGSHEIAIRFRRTWDRTFGALVSLFAAIGLLVARFRA